MNNAASRLINGLAKCPAGSGRLQGLFHAILVTKSGTRFCLALASPSFKKFKMIKTAIQNSSDPIRAASFRNPSLYM